MIEALYRRLRTTKPEPGHKVYPYLLRGAAITRPNSGVGDGYPYIPMARGFVYLAVVQSAGPSCSRPCAQQLKQELLLIGGLE